MTTCPHQGRTLANGTTFCRHPHAQRDGQKSTPVAIAVCASCLVPHDASALPIVQLTHAVPLVQTPTGTITPQLTGGPGTDLVAIFKSMGIPGCQMCYDLAARMDAWGVAECRRKSRRKQIVDEIMPRAETWAAQGRWKRAIPKAGLRASVSACVRLACWRAGRQ